MKVQFFRWARAAILVVVCCLAFADTYANSGSTYTASLQCDTLNECGVGLPGVPIQPPTTYDGNAYPFYGESTLPNVTEIFNTSMSFSASVTDFSEQISCDPVCVYNWQGDLGVGPIGIDATFLYGDDSSRDLQFIGTITGGGFSGSFIDNCEIACIFEQVDGTFSGMWSNGWRSVGSFSLLYDSIDNSGTMEMDIVTPEPNSIVLLSSSVLVLAGVLRRQLVAV